jgi:hypothetical protein
VILMVAYSFKVRFAEPILDGRKGGTIRATRKWRYGPGPSAELGGHAYPGRELQLYTGMRTRQCRLIGRKTCVAVEPIRLDFIAERFHLRGRSANEFRIVEGDDLDAFARFDGFEDFKAMADFWQNTHGDPDFDGWHIRWMALPGSIGGKRP